MGGVMGTCQHFSGRGRVGEGSAEVGGDSGAEVCEGQAAWLSPHSLPLLGYMVNGKRTKEPPFLVWVGRAG